MSIQIVKCPNHCKCNAYDNNDAYILRKYLDNHLANKCKDRLVICEHCKKNTKSKDLEDHHRICKRYPISCPNKDYKEIIPREGEDQNADTCLYTMVPCTYQEFGCVTEVMRKDLDDHLGDEKYYTVHLSLIAAELKKEKQACIALEKKLNYK